MLARLEDHDVTNQFTVLGSVKPSLFRSVTLTAILWLVDYGARHIYNRGRLGRIQTIHFARWAFLDGKKRVLFASNYDGSLEAYMDDFINKVGWGLNLVFSNGVGYPRTHWLVRDGSKSEQQFKYTLPQASTADAGLVQGLPRSHGVRYRAQHSRSQGYRAQVDDGC